MVHQTKKCIPNYLSLAYVCIFITFNTKRQAGNFAAGPRLGLLSMQGVWVPAFVREPRPHMPLGQKNQNIKQ